MQCILREKLIIHAENLSSISKIYKNESHRFVHTYFLWLEEAEKDLSGLRSPISIVLQSEKSSLSSVIDGYLPDRIQPGKSIKKIQRAAAAQSLEKVSREFYSKIEQIDHTFEQLNDQLCRAVTVIANKIPEFYSSLQATQQSAHRLWRMVGETTETKPIYNYLYVKLAATDINYLLMDLLHNIVSNNKKNELKEARV